MQEHQHAQVGNPDFNGYINHSDGNVSALLRRLREEGSPLFATAEQILGFSVRKKANPNAAFETLLS